MLSHKKITYIYLASAVCSTGLFFVSSALGIWLLGISTIIYISIVSWGSSQISSSYHIRAICQASTKTREIAITFDDGPTSHNTVEILNILKKNEIEAAFFCIGKKMNDHPEVLKRIDKEGHIIGNHSYNHGFLFNFKTEKKMVLELSETDQICEKITGKKPLFFRPPYGATTPSLARAIKNGKYRCMGWNVRSMDTIADSYHDLLDKVTSNILPGDIVLFHDTRKITCEILQEYIDAVHSRGYKFTRLDKILKIPAYA